MKVKASQARPALSCPAEGGLCFSSYSSNQLHSIIPSQGSRKVFLSAHDYVLVLGAFGCGASTKVQLFPS